MADRGRRLRPARLLAPLALLIAIGAVAYVVVNSNLVGSDDGNGSPAPTQETTTDQTATSEAGRPRRKRYRIKLNDSFGSIAEKTGVPVERLEELNPDVDPQALVVGQRIRLRE